MVSAVLSLLQKVFTYRRGRPVALVILLWALTVNTASELPAVWTPAGSVLGWINEGFGGPFRSARQFLFDAYQKRSPREPQAQPVAIVEIDEASLAKVGQWPWPRNKLAQLIDAIGHYQPAAIGLDIYMPEPDQTSPARVAANLPVEAAGLVKGLNSLPSHESILAAALRRQTTVLGAAGFDQASPTTSAGLRTVPLSIISGDPLSRVRRFEHVLASLPELQAAATGQAVLSVDLEGGVVRRIPLVLAVGERLVPGLPMEMLRVATGSPAIDITAGGHGIETLGVADLKVPTQANGEIWLHYARVGSSIGRYISAIDILEGKPHPDLLAGKLVLLGLTGIGLNDMRTTALGELVPGIEIQAQVIESLFDGRFLIRPWWMKWAESLGLLVCGLLLVWYVPRTDSRFASYLKKVPRASLWLTLGLNSVLITSGYLIFHHSGFLVDASSYFLVLSGVMGSLISSAMIEIAKVAEALAIEQQRMRDAANLVAGELKRTLDQRDGLSGMRSQLRIGKYVSLLASRLAQHPDFAAQLDPQTIDLLTRAAPLHDIGFTQAISEVIAKPGLLAADEAGLMRQHVTIGSIAVDTAAKVLGEQPDAETLPQFLKLFSEAAGGHHERWDGTGYPSGLKGDATPLAARIVAIADAYDALISHRPHRPARTPQAASEVILAGSGTQFDPRLVDAFRDLAEEFAEVAAQYPDESEPS
jgi:HD-GYP domain-containing protein (c-di-GMP phosphodiesterase class II)